jgi:hypothetical protein
MAEVKACYLQSNSVLNSPEVLERENHGLLIQILTHVVATSAHVLFGAILQFLLEFSGRETSQKCCFIRENT